MNHDFKEEKIPFPLQTSQNQVAALEQRAVLAEMLTNASIDCVAATDADLKIVAWNEACAVNSGIPKKEAIGSSFFRIFNGRQRSDALTEGVASVKAGYKVFLPAEKDAWLPGYFELHLVPLKDDAGSVKGIMMIAHDVAHRVKAENALKALNKELKEKYAELEHTNATLANYTSLTSGDVKAPLRKIYSLIEKVVTKDGTSLTNDSRGMLRRAQSSIQRLVLLAYSMITLSSLRPETSASTNLNMVLQEALSILKPQLIALQATVKAGELPEIAASGKQLRLLFQQLLTWMLRNASPGSAPELHLSGTVSGSNEALYEGQMPGTAYLVLSIANRQAANAPVATQPSVPDLGGGKYRGEEFGLAIARKIAENHLGALLFNVEENGLVSVRVCLPAGK